MSEEEDLCGVRRVQDATSAETPAVIPDEFKPPEFGVFEELNFESNVYSKCVDKISAASGAAVSMFSISWLPWKTLLKLLLVLFYNAYLAYTIYYFHSNTSAEEASDIDWCNGVGVLIIITSVVYVYNLIARGIVPGKLLIRFYRKLKLYDGLSSALHFQGKLQLVILGTRWLHGGAIPACHRFQHCRTDRSFRITTHWM